MAEIMETNPADALKSWDYTCKTKPEKKKSLEITTL
jgi:hypothetical protein